MPQTKRRPNLRLRPSILRRIRRTFDNASDIALAAGTRWYDMARSECLYLSTKYNVPLTVSVGVVAALSPGNPWSRNLFDAETLLAENSARVGVYGRRNRDKALAIINGTDPLTILSGDKVRAFYQNILTPDNPTNPVVIDRHAKCLALGYRAKRKGYASDDSKSAVKRSEYRYLERHYKRVAADVGALPNRIQAITWCAWRSQDSINTDNETEES